METDDLSQMIFAEVQYADDYADIHPRIAELMEERFSKVQSGLQGDSWIWITDSNEKVAIDTFSWMKHQVKSYSAGPLVEKVIDILRVKFDVKVLDPPVEEWG